MSSRVSGAGEGRNTAWIMALLMGMVFLVNFEFSLVMALGPRLAESYGIEGSRITYLFIGFSLTGIFAPFLGFSADKFGIKRLILVALGIFAAGSFTVSSVPSVFGYIAGRSLMGAGYFSLQSLTISYMSLVVDYSRLGSVSGLHRFAVAGAFFASPLLGSWLALHYSIALIYLILGICALILMLLSVRLPDVESSREMSLGSVKTIFSNRNAVLMILGTAALSIPSVYLYNYLSISLSSASFSQYFIGVLYTIIAAGALMAGAVIMLFSDRVGKTNTVLAGILFSISAVIMMLFQGRSLLIVSALVLGLGYDTAWGLFFPICSRLFRVGRSTYLTILSFTIGLTNVFSNVTAPTVYRSGGFLSNMAICILALTLTLVLVLRVERNMSSMKETVAEAF